MGINSKGQVRRTIGIPGTGLYNTEVVGHVGSAGSTRSPTSPGMVGSEAGVMMNVQAHDGTGGSRALLDGQPDLAHLHVVGLKFPLREVADLAGIAVNPQGWSRGLRDGLIQSDGMGNWTVYLMVKPPDNPSLFTAHDDETPKAIVLGRLGKRDVDKWSSLLGGQPTYVAIYLDATPGSEGAEVRFRPSLLEESNPNDGNASEDGPINSAALSAQPPSSVSPPMPPPPLPPAAWYPTNDGSGRLRWWDGQRWTDQFHPHP